MADKRLAVVKFVRPVLTEVSRFVSKLMGVFEETCCDGIKKTHEHFPTTTPFFFLNIRE